MALITPAFASFLGFFKGDPQELAVVIFSVQAGDGSPGFMTLHFDEAEATALASEDIGSDLDGPDLAEFRKQFGD